MDENVELMLSFVDQQIYAENTHLSADERVKRKTKKAPRGD